MNKVEWKIYDEAGVSGTVVDKWIGMLGGRGDARGGYSEG